MVDRLRAGQGQVLEVQSIQAVVEGVRVKVEGVRVKVEGVRVKVEEGGLR